LGRKLIGDVDVTKTSDWLRKMEAKFKKLIQVPNVWFAHYGTHWLS
jgi:hypothetical protein